MTVAGLPGSASNFTATVTTQPIIVTYTASDAANQTVTGVRSLTVYDPCGPSEKTCSSITFACSVNGNCGAAAAALAAQLGGGSGSVGGTPASANAAAVAAAAAAAKRLFEAPDVVPPTITILGTGQPFVTSTGSTGLITTVFVGSTYVDDGATALKVPANALLPPIDLTNSIVTTGIDTITTAAPTSSSQPFIITYDVKDRASPPNSAVTVRRRVQVVCKAEEKVCTNSDGSLSCSYGGICTGAALPPATAAAAITYPPSASIVPVLSLNGPTSITISANQPYAPCMGMTTSNCEMGATATVSTTGDFNGRIRACADMVGLPYTHSESNSNPAI